ncbi:Type I Iterative PKS [Recurvomyces mirabilis]|uniref:Type I Iterative PKS n=1 Tax=Recurvomyces mirabilis TaxID=574656 RepID=A0AAE1C0Q2_9PEZI|nr:Type I Iterative PKS [Recurvomyces mirabilis]KAK5155233.1 hypothetical protein LTS14_006188 [Recurvomyces mirabilis]
MDDLIQSQPFMPPIANGSAFQDLFVFGDSTAIFQSDLVSLLHVKSNASLQSFFDHVAAALRREVAALPAAKRVLFKSFTTLVELVDRVDEMGGAPVMHFTLLCVHQLGRWIINCTGTSDVYPRPDRAHIVGLCTGGFAAAVVATSGSLLDLIEEGTIAVRVAFRTALRSMGAGTDVESTNEPSRSWSMALHGSESEATKLVASFNESRRAPVSANVYISACAPTNVTISGPPSALREFVEKQGLKTHPLSINTPFHAPHLFDSADIDAIMQDVCTTSGQLKQRIALIASDTGARVVGEDLAQLLRRAVDGALRARIDWNAILSSSTNCLAGPQQTRIRVWPIASGASALLITALGSSAVSDERMNRKLVPDVQSGPSHRFGDSKIAIVGYSGRFPDAASNDEFWAMLQAGKDTHRTIPTDRFDWKAHYDPAGKEKNKSRVKYGCWIDEPGLFDAKFFNMSPREAENTDPSQRLAIMTAYEALEMAGFVPDRTPSSQRDRVGVFYGTTSDDWREVNSGQDVDTYFIPGGNRAFVPGRISYFFRFSGPAISVDTACSSSFAAINSACSWLWRGDCDTAIAGGTNVLTSPDNFVGLDRGHFLSTTGNCNPFDDDASGYCRADGVGSIILKRLEDAIADHDPIFGVIAGASTNHCGQTVSITRPHEGDQLALFKRILRNSNTRPEDVSYVEMHGTGTQAGDAAEMHSVLKAFVPDGSRPTSHPLSLGAVKANIGHSESASGVSALIKVLKMMQHSQIPPHVGIKSKINHNYPLDLAERNVRIHLQTAPWRRSDCLTGRRMCFLNNFSAAGGNTALLVEDSPLVPIESIIEDSRGIYPVALTARSATSLRRNMETLIEHIKSQPDIPLAALSYTTTARRSHHRFRHMFAVPNLESLVADMSAQLDQSEVKAIPAKSVKVLWAFSGQGVSCIGAGRHLFETYTTFRHDLSLFERMARQQGFPGFLGFVLDEMPTSKADTTDPVVSHLAHVCLQMAMAKLWTSWSVHPAAVVGHSLGEYAALYAAGVLTSSAVIYLVASRARLLSEHCPSGTHSMLAVKASVESIHGHLAGSGCDVACINSPRATVVSGLKQEINQLRHCLESQGMATQELDLPYAFHSPQVDPILAEMVKVASDVTFEAPKIPYISPLLGRVVTENDVLGPRYLTEACRGVVNLQDALMDATRCKVVGPDSAFVEIGSHPICSNMIKDTLGPQYNPVACMRRGTDGQKTLLEAVKALYLRGIAIDWNEVHRDFPGCHRVLDLPSYQWELKNYWIQYRNNFCVTKGDPPQMLPGPAPVAKLDEALSASVHRVIRTDTTADGLGLVTESDIHDPRLAPILEGHRVNGCRLCPSSLYVDMTMTIVRHMLSSSGRSLQGRGLDCIDMKVEKPLVARADVAAQLLHVSAVADSKLAEVKFDIYSVDAQHQRLADHATCKVVISNDQEWAKDWKRSHYLIQGRVDALRQAVHDGTAHKLKRGLAYRLFSSFVEYGHEYQGMEHVIFDSEKLEATAQVRFAVHDNGFYQSPCWIDSVGHIAGFIMNCNDGTESKGQAFINHGWESVRFARELEYGKTYTTYNRMQSVNGALYAGDTYIIDGEAIMGIVQGVKFQGVPRRMIDMVLPKDNKHSTLAPSRTSRESSTVTMTTLDAGPTRKVQVASAAQLGSPTAAKIPVASKTSDVATKLLDVVAQETGINAADLDIAVDLASLGIDSLLTLTISGRVKDELGVSLDMTEDTTLKDLLASVSSTGATTPASSIGARSSSAESHDSTDTSPSSIEDDEDDTDVLQVVRAVIARETGLPLEDLRPETSLDELGVDSLLALTMISALSETLGKSLPPTIFADSETIWDVENILGMNGYITQTPRPGNQNASGHPTASSSTTRVEVSQLLVLQPPHATSVCLQGNAKTATTTIFLFPDGAGSAISYAQLPDVSPKAVVYGLNCPWMRAPEGLTCSLEDYVAKFLVEVRRRQPTGPYFFGGWSAGGILAYEAAQQLARVGETISRLVLLDSPDPVGLQNPPPRLYDFLEAQDMFGMEGKSAPKWLRPHMTAFIHMLDRYTIRAFNDVAPSTWLIYARDGLCKPGAPRPATRPDDPREMLWLINERTDFTGGGWSLLIGQKRLRVNVVDDANHYTIMSAPQAVAQLSTFIAQACL